MLSIPVAEAFASLDAAVAAVGAIDWDRLPALERLDALDRLETVRRRHSVTCHDITGSLDRDDGGQIGPTMHKVISDVLRISPAVVVIAQAGNLQQNHGLPSNQYPLAARLHCAMFQRQCSLH